MTLNKEYLQHNISFLIALIFGSSVPSFVVPIRNISLGSVPYGEVEDGSETAFLCSVKEGSWPILFRIFRKTDRDVLLFERSEHADRVIWQKKEMSRQDTGTYYCIASNRANVSAKSHPITINGKLNFVISCAFCHHGRQSLCYLKSY